MFEESPKVWAATATGDTGLADQLTSTGTLSSLQGEVDLQSVTPAVDIQKDARRQLDHRCSKHAAFWTAALSKNYF